MALNTVGDFISQVRFLMQDADGTRYTDAALRDALGNGMAEVRRIRPDVFFGLVVPTVDTNASDMSQVPSAYRVLLVDYMCGYAERSDQDGSDAGRATLYQQRFLTQLSQPGA